MAWRVWLHGLLRQTRQQVRGRRVLPEIGQAGPQAAHAQRRGRRVQPHLVVQSAARGRGGGSGGGGGREIGGTVGGEGFRPVPGRVPRHAGRGRVRGHVHAGVPGRVPGHVLGHARGPVRGPVRGRVGVWWSIPLHAGEERRQRTLGSQALLLLARLDTRASGAAPALGGDRRLGARLHLADARFDQIGDAVHGGPDRKRRAEAAWGYGEAEAGAARGCGGGG
eukprot:scaffold5731_cov119-Isochrysis_galbana.AAC.3